MESASEAEVLTSRSGYGGTDSWPDRPLYPINHGVSDPLYGGL